MPYYTKNYNYVLIIFYAFTLVFFSGCMATTQMQVLSPAAFNTPTHIQTIVTVNRSAPANIGGNIIEAIVTNEQIGQDREGAKQALIGLADALQKTPRFKVTHSNITLEGGGTLGFKAPIEWQQIEQLCKTYNADAVAALELYDSDNLITGTTNTTTVEKEGRKVKKTEYLQTLNTSVKLGWRLYDPQNKTILDEFEVNENRSWNTSDNSQQAALNKLPPQTTATAETSLGAGILYGKRIAPVWNNLQREYYYRKNDNLKKAHRLAQTNQWQKAADTWERMLLQTNLKNKYKAQAAYNLAVAYEAQDNLPKAIEWAKKAYTQYNNKNAKPYAAELQRRLQERSILDDQMKNKK